ncbi:GNAT family N-acetyltransferase [Glycomyces arizonensis]|uniref:GNAT family N-acetyltransferase n=1 Tax=Glycomyces arizonensis TaxID=256035 RepID=UPI0003F81A4B|nr:N-acetyltransferase [Glycomyces arizonensis]
MEIREERAADAAAVRGVHETAFGGDGAKVADLNDALRATLAESAGLSLVAIEGGEVVGHVLFTTSLLDAPRRLAEVQVLSPVGVRPEKQRRGVGSALIRRGLEILDERSVPLVFLEGDPAYYRRLGFRPGGGLGFRKPSLRIPDAAFQVYPLAAHEPWMTGTLVYSPVFWQHDCVGLRDPEP